MKRRSNLPLYLLLNVIVSAVTTLVVLVVWDNLHANRISSVVLPVATQAAGQTAQVQAAVTLPAAPDTTPAAVPTATAVPTAAPTSTLPGADTPLIQVLSVVGAGDLDQEVVLLRRLGEGNLSMTGWRLEGDRGAKFAFPDKTELILYKDGAVQVYSKAGTDTATEVYWNRTEAAWRSGETLKVIDRDDVERAVYVVP